MTAQPATPREVIARALAAAWDGGDDYGVLDESQEADRILAALAGANMRIAGPDEAVVKIPEGHSIMFVKTSVESMSANVSAAERDGR